MWKVGNTVITEQMADDIHNGANDERSISSLVAMVIRDHDVDPDDAEKVVQAVLDING